MSGAAAPAPPQCQRCGRDDGSELTLTARTYQRPDRVAITVLASGGQGQQYVPQPTQLEATFADGTTRRFHPPASLDGSPLTAPERAAFLAGWTEGVLRCRSCRDEAAVEATRRMRSDAAAAAAARQLALEQAQAAAAAEARARALAAAEERERVIAGHHDRLAQRGLPDEPPAILHEQGAQLHQEIAALRGVLFRADQHGGSVDKTLVENALELRLVGPLTAWHLVTVAAAIVGGTPAVWPAALVGLVVATGAGTALARHAMQRRLADRWYQRIVSYRLDDRRRRLRMAAVASALVAMGVLSRARSLVDAATLEAAALAALAGAAAGVWRLTVRARRAWRRSQVAALDATNAALAQHRQVVDQYRCGQAGCPRCAALPW